MSTVARFAQIWRLDAYAQRTQSLVMAIEKFYPYNAFVDESIQERYGLKATGVAAYVATFSRWLELEKEWRGILNRFEVPLDGKAGHDQPFWHTTDFIAGKQQFQNDWSHEKRDELMERMTMTASEYTTVGVAVSVNNAEFERLLPDDARGFWRDPYFFCVWGMLQSLSTMEERFGVVIHKPLWFLFDPRQKARQFAGEIFYTVKSQSTHPEMFGEMGFGEMWRTPQIQAADLLVYEATRHLIEYQHDQSVGLRKSLQTLGRKKNLFVVEVDEERLRAYVEFARRVQRTE